MTGSFLKTLTLLCSLCGTQHLFSAIMAITVWDNVMTEEEASGLFPPESVIEFFFQSHNLGVEHRLAAPFLV